MKAKTSLDSDNVWLAFTYHPVTSNHISSVLQKPFRITTTLSNFIILNKIGCGSMIKTLNE